MKASRLNKAFHKWLSVVIGAQLLIWLLTGLYFNVIDHHKAGGNSHRQKVIHQTQEVMPELVPISNLPVLQPQSVRLIWILGKPYYLVVHDSQPHSYQKQQRQLIDAVTAKHFTLGENTIKTIALKSYTGKAQILDTNLVKPPIDELPKYENPLWKVRLKDDNNTHVYIDAMTGKVVAHINDDRRLRDLMFKLHFMDYANKGTFNHWLIILFGIGTLLLSFTGVAWVIELWREGELKRGT